MFGRLGQFVVHNPWKVIAAWVVAAVAIVAFAPTPERRDEQRDQAGFLPDTYESVQATGSWPRSRSAQGGNQRHRDDRGHARRRPAAHRRADQAKVGELAEAIQAAGIDAGRRASPAPQAVVAEQARPAGQRRTPGARLRPEVARRRHRTSATSPSRLLAGTGLRLLGHRRRRAVADNQDAFNNALDHRRHRDGRADHRPAAAHLPQPDRGPAADRLTVGVVIAIAPASSPGRPRLFGLQVDQSLQIILTIVLFGIGTDYILFLLFRYRERLRAGDEPSEALVTAVARVGEVIASAAGAVIDRVHARCCWPSSAASRSLGPGLAIAVVVMALAALTLVPAIVSLIGTARCSGRRSRGSSTPKGTVFAAARRVHRPPPGGGGARLRRPAGRARARRASASRRTTTRSASCPPTPSRRRASRTCRPGFPAGALNPTTVYLRATDGQPAGPGRPRAVRQPAHRRARGRRRHAGAARTAARSRLNSDGTAAQINLLLDRQPVLATEALDAGRRRAARAGPRAAPPGTTALVGGTSSAFADIRDANNRDLSVIFPVAGRADRADPGPAAAQPGRADLPDGRGGAGLLRHPGRDGVSSSRASAGRPGISFQLPIILYLFVVAIGTDYNILMIARLREEAREGHEPATAADLAVEHAGPSVGAAGLILAGTFGSLMLAGIAFLTEMGFAVALGIVLSAFVMSMFLVPSITALLGHKAWWPGHGDAATDTETLPEPAGAPTH